MRMRKGSTLSGKRYDRAERGDEYKTFEVMEMNVMRKKGKRI